MSDEKMAKPGIDLDEIEAVERQSILIVDDDLDNIVLLKHILRLAGYDVFSTASGEEALKKSADKKPDLILLDIMMPEMDGWETFDFLKQITDAPVIFVSALNEKKGIVQALLDGVDDYITKPFYNDEVIARVKTVLRRAGDTRKINRLVFPNVGLTIDMVTKEVMLDDMKVQLTHKEFEVLTILAKHAPNVVDYQTITQVVWGEDSDEARKRAKYLIYLLRRKFGDNERENRLIVNVDRLGYKLHTDD